MCMCAQGSPSKDQIAEQLDQVIEDLTDRAYFKLSITETEFKKQVHFYVCFGTHKWKILHEFVIIEQNFANAL